MRSLSPDCVYAAIVMASSAARCAARWVSVTVSSNVRTYSTFAFRPNGALAKFGGGVFWSTGSRVGEGTEKVVTLTGLLGEQSGLAKRHANG